MPPQSRREIRKEVFIFNTEGPFGLPVNYNMITASETETLVRTLVDLTMYSSEVTLNIETRIRMQFNKTTGIVVAATPSNTQALETPKPDIISRKSGVVINLSAIAGYGLSFVWNEMLKSKRILKRGEFLYLSLLVDGSNTATLHLTGSITMWFLE